MPSENCFIALAVIFCRKPTEDFRFGWYCFINSRNTTDVIVQQYSISLNYKFVLGVASCSDHLICICSFELN